MSARLEYLRTLLWLGPTSGRRQWATIDVHHAIVDVSHSGAVIGLQGLNARDVLMKGTNIDLHPRQFGPDNSHPQGSSRSTKLHPTHLGGCHMLVRQLDDGPSYDIYVHRSLVIYGWNWLSDAARE